LYSTNYINRNGTKDQRDAKRVGDCKGERAIKLRCRWASRDLDGHEISYKSSSYRYDASIVY
jgi:hypothetical protein